MQQSRFEESFHTVLVEIENVINSRPLSPQSQRLQQPEADLAVKGQRTSSAEWRKVQHIVNKFWERWCKEYLIPCKKDPNDNANSKLLMLTTWSC